MISRDGLLAYLDDFLVNQSFNDYAPNGLQIEGTSSINRICTAVTASQSVIAEAVRLKADALLVHHGYFWKGESPVLTGMKRQRIGQLIVNNMNLLAYHLPLDCHLELGNNASLGKLLQMQDIKTHTANQISSLLWSGHLIKSLSIPEFTSVLTHLFNREPVCVFGSEKPIHHVAWCSGGAQDLIEQAHRLGADAYISGEISERTYYQAQELGIHYFACGHHATERYGIQALGEHLKQRFDVVHAFIDSDNPV